MLNIYISYFLLIIYSLILIYKYLCEKSIIEKFQALPTIDIIDLKLLTTIVDRLVKGEPFKVLNTLYCPNFFIGQRKFDSNDTNTNTDRFNRWENLNLMEMAVGINRRDIYPPRRGEERSPWGDY